jgi:hypothetical protein
MTWFEQYASIIAYFVQLAFYVVVAASALWAAITFWRYVRYMTTEEVEEAGESEGEQAAGDTSDEDKLIDEFVD